MNIILPSLIIAFTAVCVWLMVRIVNRRERWAKWTLAAIVGLPVLYIASFGPACWLFCWAKSHALEHEEHFNTIWMFKPLTLMMPAPDKFDDMSIPNALLEYALLCTDGSWRWGYISRDGPDDPGEWRLRRGPYQIPQPALKPGAD